MKSIAEKTKKVEDVTGFFKTKFSGKGDVKDVLSVVSVSWQTKKYIFLFSSLIMLMILIVMFFHNHILSYMTIEKKFYSFATPWARTVYILIPNQGINWNM